MRRSLPERASLIVTVLGMEDYEKGNSDHHSFRNHYFAHYRGCHTCFSANKKYRAKDP